MAIVACSGLRGASRDNMSIQAVAWALEQELPARPKLVLVAIANHANHVDGYCWLRAETIAHEAACGVRSVYRFVGALERNGFIRRESRKAKNGQQLATTDYWLLLDRPIAGLWTSRGEIDIDEADDSNTISGGLELEPSANMAVGPSDSPGTKPSATAGTLRDSVEPSKINRGGQDRIREMVQRTYKPPTPKVEKPKEITGLETMAFVIEGTRAWKAWLAYRRSIGRPLNYGHAGDGPYKGKTGRWLPSLFPPGFELLEHPDSSDESWQARNPAQNGI